MRHQITNVGAYLRRQFGASQLSLSPKESRALFYFLIIRSRPSYSLFLGWSFLKKENVTESRAVTRAPMENIQLPQHIVMSYFISKMKNKKKYIVTYTSIV